MKLSEIKLTDKQWMKLSIKLSGRKLKKPKKQIVGFYSSKLIALDIEMFVSRHAVRD